MAQVPKIGADHDIGHDLIGQRRRDTECRFVLPLAQVGAGGLRLVKQIEAPEQAILDEFSVGFELGFQAVVHDFRAARLVTAVKFRFERQRDRDWRWIAINQDRAKLSLEAVNCRHVAVVETWNAVDVVIGHGRTKYDLHVLRWRIFIFKRGLADTIMSAAPLPKLASVSGSNAFSPSMPVDDPTVKFPKMYLFSTSWNASASCARATPLKQIKVLNPTSIAVALNAPCCNMR